MAHLRISIDISTPMVEPGDLFHLDALLGALRVQKAYAEFGDAINPRDYHYDLPLERYQAPGGDWVFKASAFKLDHQLPLQNWMQTSRINLAEAARHRSEGYLLLRSAKPNPAGGPFKTSIYYKALAWSKLTAYCIGEQSQIETLLRTCKQIGGRRGVGFGLVHNISIEEVSATECLWNWRALPADTDQNLVTSDHALCIAGLRGPYWDRALHVEALSPTC